MSITPVTAKDEAVARLIALIRKNLKHLPVFTHAALMKAIADIEGSERKPNAT